MASTAGASDLASRVPPDEQRITPTTPTRLPFTGSCHCGATRYIVFITLPFETPNPPAPGDHYAPRPRQVTYRCNCTTCVKTGYFHLRVASPPDDFMLLAPLNPLTGGLHSYMCNDRIIHWLSCKTCAVSCILFGGVSEVVELDEPEVLKGMEWAKEAVTYVGDGAGGGDVAPSSQRAEATSSTTATKRKIKVWRPKPGLWKEGPDSDEEPIEDDGGDESYLSVNAQTLDVGQEGLDLREWTELKFVWYLDTLERGEKQTRQRDRPMFGGTYCALQANGQWPTFHTQHTQTF
jgi:hypothetical protein